MYLISYCFCAPLMFSLSEVVEKQTLIFKYKKYFIFALQKKQLNQKQSLNILFFFSLRYPFKDVSVWL